MSTCRYLLAGAILLVRLATAQEPNTQEPNSQERSPRHTGAVNLDVLGGWSFGGVGSSVVSLPDFNNFRIDGQGGGSGAIAVGVSLHPRLLFIAEAALFNGSHLRSDLGSGYTAETYTRAAVYDVSIQWRFRADATRGFIPYLGAGPSTVQNRASVLVLFTAPEPGQKVSSAATESRLHQATFAISGAAGVRYYINHWFGLRFEAKGYFPTGIVKQPFGRVAAGVFIQLH